MIPPFNPVRGVSEVVRRDGTLVDNIVDGIAKVRAGLTEKLNIRNGQSQSQTYSEPCPMLHDET